MQTDQSPSQDGEIDVEPPSECPACDSTDFISLPDIPQPICEDCGLLPNADDSSDFTSTAEETTDEPDQWSEFRSVSNGTEQQVALALDQLDHLGEDFDLSPEALIQSAEVYADAAIEQFTDGRSTSLVVCAAVCVGTRKVGEPCPSNRVAEASDVEPKRLKRVIRLLHQSLDYEYTISDPEAYLSFLRRELNLATAVEKQARDLLEEVDDTIRIEGKHPVGIAAAALYNASDRSVTQREVARVAGITQETIRLRLEEVRQARRAD